MAAVLSIMMLAAIALLAGAFYLWRRGASRLQVALMLVMVGVIAANIAIWTLPGEDRAAPMQQTPR